MYRSCSQQLIYIHVSLFTLGVFRRCECFWKGVWKLLFSSTYIHTCIEVVLINVYTYMYIGCSQQLTYISTTDIQTIPLEMTFPKAQSSKLERLFCHVSVRVDVRALSFELWNSIRKYHPKWDWQYIVLDNLYTPFQKHSHLQNTHTLHKLTTCSVLQCVAVCRYTLQHTAKHCKNTHIFKTLTP